MNSIGPNTDLVEKLDVPKRLLRPVVKGRQLGLWAYSPQAYLTSSGSIYVEVPFSKRAKALFLVLAPVFSITSRSDQAWYDAYDALYDKTLKKVPTVELFPGEKTYSILIKYSRR